MKRARGYGLKFITKNDTTLRYDGFKDTVRDVLLSVNDICRKTIYDSAGYRAIERVHNQQFWKKCGNTEDGC